MASYDAAINLIVNGGSKIDNIINKAAQLEGIVNKLNQNPLDLNVKKAASEFDKFDTNLKAARATIVNQQKAIDQAGSSIEKYINKITSTQNQLSKLNPNTQRYNKVLEDQKKAIAGLASAQGDLASAQEKLAATEEKIGGIQKAAGRAKGIKIATEAISSLADEYLRLGAAQQKGASGQILKNQSQSTIAQLAAQAEALKLVADNSEIASSQFNRFAIASQLASQKIYEGRQKRLGALAFGLSAEAPSANVGRGGESSIAASRNLVSSLITSGGEVVKSEAALSDYAERLRSIQSLVPYASNEFRALEEALAGVNQELSQIGLRGQKSAIQGLSGPATDLGSLKAFQLRESFQKKINDQLNRQDSIQERISQASLFDFQKKKLTLQLDEAVAALAENRLGDAQRLTREIDRQRISMERMNRAAQKPQVFGALGTAFMPVTGELPGGNVPGSPAARVAEAKANRESTQAAVALAKQKQKAIEDEAEELRKGTQAATALGKQKLKALQDEAERLRQETSNAVALAQQKMREEERAIAQAWKMRGGPELPPSMGGGIAGVRGQSFRAGGPGAATAALSAPRRVEALVRSTQLAQEKLNELEIRGVDVTAEKASAQKILNSLKEKDLQISDQLLNNVDDELNLIRDILRLEKQRLTNQRLLGGGADKKAGPEGSGLQQALKRLEEARGARQAFLGGASPAQAIDQIVREFNKGGPAAGNAAENIADTFASNLKKGASGAAASAKSFATAAAQAIKDVFGIASPSRFMIELVRNLVSTYIAEIQKSYPRIQAATDKAFGEQTLIRNVKQLRATNRGFEFTERPSRGFRPFREAQGFGRGAEGATQEFNNMMLDFRKQIAELTTQPEIFSNLLRGLPDARITTDLIGAANRRALASELPSFMPTQRMMGPGELEREIAKAFADYVRTIRTPDPWVGLVGDYREFIDKVIAQTQRLSTGQAALPSVRIAGALPAAEQRITSVQQQRIQRAYERSAQRQLAVLSEDVFAGAGRPALSAASFGFMADPARIGRLSGIGRALPPAIGAAASVVDGESRDLREAVRSLFERIEQGIRSAFSSFGGFGGGGGGGRPLGGGGADAGRGGAPNQVAQLLGFDAIADISRVSTRELEALSAAASELRAVLDPTIEGFDRLDNQLRETIGQIGRQIERRAPEAGFLTRQLGPRGARAASEGLIGGAFPLLFGQGLGATVGGGLGGALGGFAGGGLGFGLSLAGTAIGTAFDTATESAKNFTVALEDTGDATGVLETALGRIDKETKTLIGNLAESGQRAAAAKASFEALAEKIGTEQAEAFQRAGQAASSWGVGVQTQLTKLYANAVLLAEAIAKIFPQPKTSVFDIVEAKPEQPFTQEARDRLEDLLGQNNLLEKQVALSRLNTDASVDQRLQLERQVALQDYVNSATELERQLKQNLLSQQEYNLRLKGSELNLTKQLYDLENAAAQERENRARQARQEAERAAKEQERAIASVLGLQSELMQVGLAGADIDIEGARVRGGDIAAIEEELNQLQQRFNYEAKILDLQLQQKLTSSDISQQEKGLLESIYRQQLGNLEAQYKVKQATLQQASAQLQLDKFIATEEAKRQAIDPFTQFRQSQQLDQQYAQNYYRLLVEGIAPAEAQRLANFERLVNQQLNAVDSQIAITQAALIQAEAYGASADKINELKKNLDDLNASRGAITQEAARGAGPAPQEIPGVKIQEFISTAEEELKDLEAVAVRVSQGIGDAIASSMANGITGLIEGTTTAKEVFAGFLKDVGNILIKEGTRMIGMYVAIGIAKMFAGLFGGGGGNPAGSGGGISDILPGARQYMGGADAAGNLVPNLTGFANGGVAVGGFRAFAKGGAFTNSVVASPTLFKFADGGVQRTGLMGEAGPEAIMPLRRSANGRLGVEASGLREAMNSGAGGGMGAPSLNMTFETTNIGGVEYVSRDQLEAAMAATRRDAARDGAKRGMSMTLDKLQQSPGTRGRIGLR